MLLRRAVLAAHPRTPAAACLLPNLGLHTQTILQPNTWRCHQSPVAPSTSHIQQAAAAAHLTVAPAPAAVAVAAVTQRGLCLRCYSNSAASTSGSSTSETSSGQRKLKYNLRPLNKDDVDYTFARSGGAGGQNVNKVNTKVDMRFDLDKAGWIPDEVKEAMRRGPDKNRFTKEGMLVMTSTRHRTQSQNLDDCLSKLQAMVDAAVEAVTPKEIDPETVKRVKAAIKAGNERRLDGKKKDAKKKTERRRRDFD